MAMFQAFKFVLEFLEPNGSQAQLAWHARLGRTCHAAQRDFPGDVARAARDIYEALEDEIVDQLERDERVAQEDAEIGWAMFSKLVDDSD